MTTRGQGFCFHISCERTALWECSTFKGTVPWATWRLFHQLEEAVSSAAFHHPGPCGFASFFALTAIIAFPGEGKPQFTIWLKTQGRTSCLQLVKQRKRMAGQGDKGTVGGVAFGTNTALNGFMFNMKSSPWTCNILWSFGRSYYVQILTKISCGKHGKSE